MVGLLPPIVLLTDFGHYDPCVGIMKGVILSISPTVRIVDLNHEVPAFDVRGAAGDLKAAIPYFPKGTVFVTVVDPGVGGSRKIVVAKTSKHLFLAPDNGLLGFLRGAKFHAVSRSRYFLKPVSNTFHGRDIFAPVAAWLAEGLGPGRLGPELRSIRRLPAKKGIVVSIDRFGNLITDLAGKRKSVAYGRIRIPVARTYASAPKGSLVAVVGSRGTIEISVVQGSAAAVLGAKVGDRVK